MSVSRATVALAALAACSGKHSARSDATVRGVDAAVARAPADAGKPAKPTKPARVEHVSWKPVDNRHSAHRTIDGEVVLDARDIGFARFTRFGVPAPRWHLGQTVDGERAAIADRLASLELPIAADQVGATQITARVHGDAKQAVTVKVNGRSAGKHARIVLDAGWQTVAFRVERGRFGVGENQLVFETAGGKHGVAFAWLRIGNEHPAGDDDPLAAGTFDAKADAIELAENAQLAWYITVPDGANFVIDGITAGCHALLAARAGDTSLVGGLLGGDTTRLDLSGLAGKVARLSLTARDCPRAKLARPRITLHGPEPQVLPKSDPPRYVVLWVMDALRADKIPVFTPGARAQTPNFEEIAKSSTVFRQFYVQGNESQVSHSSIWTSLYPAAHGVRDIDISKGGSWKLDPKLALLAQQMSDAGYYTIGVTGNGFIYTEGGYTRGFNEFRNPMREGGVMNNFIAGQVLVDLALGELDKHRDAPAYLFLGTIDTHGPWVARKPWIDLYSPGPYHGPFQDYGTAKELGITPTSMGCAIVPPPADIERLRAIYDSAVSYHDLQLGRLVHQLQAWGIWDQTMLIVTGDHGEEMFEEGRCGHGASLRDSLLRVPLLVHDPSRFPGGTVVDEGAECIDVLPTILAALGKPPLAAAQGEALEPLAQGAGRGWARPSYASMYEYAHAMRIGRWKMRVGPNGVPVVNDMVRDPEERVDVAVQRPVERRMLEDHLSLFLALRKVWTKREWGVLTNVTAEGAAALDDASTP